MQTQTKHIPTREMHKYVLGIIGIFILFAASFPIACLRVSQHKKFANYQFHLKSLTLDGQLPNQPVVNQPSGQTMIGGMTKQTAQVLGVESASLEAQSVNATNQIAEITDPEQLAALNQKLYDQIAQNWQSRRFEQKLVYRVSVSQDGAIASYESLNQPALDYVQQTPLPNLVATNRHDVSTNNSIGAKSGSTTHQPLGKFEVVFTRRGILEVSPWQGWRN